jgi:DNA invertase Pin-like site-specific DNA recombinase
VSSLSKQNDSPAAPPAVPTIRYTARSKEEEAGRDSTGDQLRELDEWIEREPGRFAYGAEHADHASGFRGDRGPALEAAIAEALRAKAEYGRAELLAVKSERFARGSGREQEARSLMELWVELRRAGIELRTVHDDAFVTNSMLIGVADAMANKYSADLSAHIKRGLASRARAGRPPSSPAFGYRRSGEGVNMTWAPEPREAKLARRIFSEFADNGHSFSGIAKQLNSEGIPSRKGSEWAPRVVAQLLKSRHVLGEFRSGAEWVRPSGEQAIEPIIDRALWERAQAQLERNAKYRPKGSSGRLPKEHLFVRGALRCARCGSAMLPRSVGEREWYVCRTRAETHGQEACSTPVLERAEVDTLALEIFQARCLDVDATKGRLQEQLDQRIGVARAEAERAAAEGMTAQQALERADRDYAEGELGPRAYSRQTEAQGAALDAAQAEYERLAAQADQLAAALSSLDTESEVLRRLAELRDQVAQRMTSAGSDLLALRAAMAAVFQQTLVSEGPSGLGLEPHLRPEFAADAGFPQGARPTSRVALGLDLSGEKNAIAAQVLDQIRTSSA